MTRQQGTHLSLALLATVLLVLSSILVPAVVTAGPTASPPAPPVHEGRLGPARVVTLSQLPRSAASAHPARVLPFLPRDLMAFQRAKQRANAGPLPSRGSVPTSTLAGPRTAVSPLQAEQGVTSFPVMSYEQQVSLLGPDQKVEPPDTQLAAGPTYLLETVNDSGSVWTKTGSLVKIFDLNTFFPVPFGYTFSDPRVLYDPLSGRWFVSGLSFDSAHDSQVSVAVSVTSDPTGSWYTYTVESNSSGVLYDQPKIGVSSDKVVISWNDFYGPANPSGFSGQETWVLQKAAMLAGSSPLYWGFGPDSTRFDLVPAQSLSSTSPEYLVYNNADPTSGSENQPYPALGVVEITGTPAQGNVAWTEWDPGMAATSIPPSAIQPGGGTIDTDDDRLLSATWQNGVLWTGGNDACVPAGDSTTRSCLRLIQVSTTGATPTISQSFDVGLTGGYLSYPAVSLDGTGDAFFAFSVSSATLYASAETTAQAIGAPVDSVGGTLVLAGGWGAYGGSRWGDYSAAAPDPANGSAVWVTGEYAASSTDSYDWGTATGEMILTPPPTVTPTPVPSATPTSTPSPTSTPAGSATPTSTPSPTTTAVPSPTPTSTPVVFRVYLPAVFNNATGGQ